MTADLGANICGSRGGSSRGYGRCIMGVVSCKIMFLGPCGARGRCRISPPRFMAECRKRRLNQDSFVSAVCLDVCFL